MLTEKDELKIANGAIQILKNPKAFCKSHWFLSKQVQDHETAGGSTDAEGARSIDPTHEDGYDQLADYCEQSGASLANPTFQVCGEGAIYTSAAIQGFSYGEARQVLIKVTGAVADNPVVEESYIPEINDNDETTRPELKAVLEDGFAKSIKGFLKGASS